MSQVEVNSNHNKRVRHFINRLIKRQKLRYSLNLSFKIKHGKV